ncbi:unnamed protein product [Cylicocyclus nassatus]|uniref:Uncharacterized protein n=1 Tax=Cylicocyclus nassatus TaxID=53992 RepID=A0AA36M9X3_CYLNA|nr:unnamed protein product [Cylicocyclus nassatus]
MSSCSQKQRALRPPRRRQSANASPTLAKANKRYPNCKQTDQEDKVEETVAGPLRPLGQEVMGCATS